MQWLAVIVGCLLTVGAAALNADGCDDSMCKYGGAYRDKGEVCRHVSRTAQSATLFHTHTHALQTALQVYSLLG